MLRFGRVDDGTVRLKAPPFQAHGALFEVANSGLKDKDRLGWFLMRAMDKEKSVYVCFIEELPQFSGEAKFCSARASITRC